MQYKQDIFISYAHLDNEAPFENQEGWVSLFHRALEVRVGQLLGKKPEVWRDPKLQGNDLFADTLVDQLPQVAVLVSVITPRYVQSEWCVRELKTFCEAAQQRGGIRQGNKVRLFKVIKTPTPLEAHPEEMQPLLGYEFFKQDRASGRVRELDHVFGAEAQREFWTRLDDLAHDIVEILQGLSTSPASGTPETVLDKGSVYLATTSFDLKEERDALKRDLQRHGWTVLPDGDLPLVATEVEAHVRQALSASCLSIHAIGRNYGVVPEGADQSLIVLQHELAVERSKLGDFFRVIWLPRDLDIEDERQQDFAARLRTDPRLQDGADLLETPIEELKTVIHEKLAEKSTTVAAAEGGDELTRIYLICDQRDKDSTGPLEAYLFEQGYEVIASTFEGDEAEVREDHEDNLRSCDAALIYYGAGNELWLRRKLRELRKAAGLGRTQPMRAKAILVAPPGGAQKDQLRTREAEVLKQPDGDFQPEVLRPFLDSLS